AFEAVEEALLHRARMRMDRGDAGAGRDEPVHGGVEAIQARRIERRAPEAHAARAVRDGFTGTGREQVEGRIPTRVDRTQLASRRYREKARAFARHRVLVAAAEVENALPV